jgi:tetratricopeptide (TPR) repeat protein
MLACRATPDMKYILITLLLVGFFLSATAQTDAVDSLRRSLANQTQDSSRTLLLSWLSRAYLMTKPDTALLLAQEGFSLARKINYPRGEAYCLTRIGCVFGNTGNFPKAMEILLESLKMAEKINDPRLSAMIYTNIAYIYSAQGDERRSLDYTLKAKQLIEAIPNGIGSSIDEKGLAVALINIGNSYLIQKHLDSARTYVQQAYELAIRLDDHELMGYALGLLGTVYNAMQQPALAMDYYRLALADFTEENTNKGISSTALHMAKLFSKAGKADSTLYYARLASSMASKGGFMEEGLDASTFLMDYYKSNHMLDSAFVYIQLSMADKDSLFSQEKVRQVQNLSFEESLRQQALAEEKEKEAKIAGRNLQLAGIAVFIPIFSLFVLLLSRKKVKNRTIEFLGIFALLLMFEFITLLVHPYVEHWTNDTPIAMLAILVAIATFLVPLHHKLEGWVKRRLAHRAAVVPLPADKVQGDIP